MGIFVGYDPAKEDDLLSEGSLFILSYVDSSADGRLLPINRKASKGVPSALAGLKGILLAADINIIDNMPKLLFEKIELLDGRNTFVGGPRFPNGLVVSHMDSKDEQFKPSGVPKTGRRAIIAFASV